MPRDRRDAIALLRRLEGGALGWQHFEHGNVSRDFEHSMRRRDSSLCRDANGVPLFSARLRLARPDADMSESE
jgi:hypothetical protein